MSRSTACALASLTVMLVLPVLLVLSLSLSPTTGMDFFNGGSASLRWWHALFTDGSWLDSLVSSLAVACACSTVALGLALPALLHARMSGSVAGHRLLAVATFSYAVPPIVLAVGLLQLVTQFRMFDTPVGLALAHLAFCLPVIVFVLHASFREAPLGLYLMARALGAGPLRASWTWLMATQRRALVGAFLASTLISMSEVTVTLYVTDVQVASVSRKAMSGVARNIEPTGFAAMGAWMICVGIGLAVMRRIRSVER